MAVAFTSGLDLTGGVVGGVQIDNKVTVSFSRFQLGLREDIVVSEVHVALENIDGLLVDSVSLFDSVLPVGESVSFSDDGFDSMDDVVGVSITRDDDVSFVSIEVEDALLFVPHKLYRVVTEREADTSQPPVSVVGVIRPEDKPTFIPSIVREPYYGVSIRSSGIERVGLLFNHESFEGNVSSFSVDGNVVVFSTDTYRLWGCDELVFSSSWGVSDIIIINIDSTIPTKALGDDYEDSIARVLVWGHGSGNSSSFISTSLTQYNYNYNLVNTSQITSTSMLFDYEFVILSAGNTSSAIPEPQKGYLWEFVNQSGHIWIEGGEIGNTHNADGDFAKFVLFTTGLYGHDPQASWVKGTYSMDEHFMMNETVSVSWDADDNKADRLVMDSANITKVYTFTGLTSAPIVYNNSNIFHIFTTFKIGTLTDDWFREELMANIFQIMRPFEKKMGVHPDISVDGSVGDWLGTATTNDDMMTHDNQEFIWNDASSDDDGNGTFSYPSGGRWTSGSLDLLEWRCASNSTYTYFLFDFENVTNNQSYYYGFSEVVISWYLGTGGIVEGLNNTNVSFLEATDSCFILTGEGLNHYSSAGGWEYNVSQALISANVSGGYIEVGFPTSYCGFGYGDEYPLYMMVGAYDDAGGFKDITASEGKMDSTHPNVYDFVFGTDRMLMYGTNTATATYNENRLSGSAYIHVDGASTLYQSFVAQEDFTIKYISLYASDGDTDSSGTDRLRVRIETDSGNAPSGTNVTSEEYMDFTITTYEWQEVMFTSTANLVSGTRYWIRIACTHNHAVQDYGYNVMLSANNTDLNDSARPYIGTTNYWDYDTLFILEAEPKFTLTSHLMVVVAHPIVINEVSTYGEGDEWIEFYNFGGSSVDMADWTLSNLDGDTYTFGSVSISAGAYLVLHIVASSNTSSNTTLHIYWKNSINFFDDVAGEIQLNDTRYWHNMVDYLAYGSIPSSLPRDVNFYGTTIPSAPSSGGSLSRYPNGQDYDGYGDWDREYPTGYMVVTMGGENQVIPFLSNIMVLLVVVVVFFVSKKRRGRSDD